MKKNKNESWFRRLIKKFLFAFRGIKAAYKQEQSFRIQLIIAVIVIISGVIVHVSTIEWIFIIIAIGTVLSLELLNSMIEKFLDNLHPEAHERVKIIKDISAATVLIASCMAIIIGLIIFIPYICGCG